MQQQVATRVLIVTSDTGGGHTSTAKALAAGFQHYCPDFNVTVRIVHALEGSHALARWMGQFYNFLLRHRQHWVKYYYAFIERVRPNESELLYLLTRRYFEGLLTSFKPHVVVSVHPMTQHFLAKAIETLGCGRLTRLLTVVTDPCYGFWHGWACNAVERYFVATEAARAQLVDYAVPIDRVQITGLPIQPDFAPDCLSSRNALRVQLGLNPEKFTVFVNAGWIGGGNIPQIFARLHAAGARVADIQVLFLAGRNAKLRQWAEQLAERSPFACRVVGHTDAMPTLMAAADVMVSKLGGLTTFEALTMHLPIIADATTPPMPQEAATLGLLREHGAGLVINNADDIVPLIDKLLHNPDEVMRLRQAAASIATPDATRLIVGEMVRASASSRMRE